MEKRSRRSTARSGGFTLLHVSLALLCLLIFAGTVLSISAAIRQRTEKKRARKEAVDAFGSLLSRDSDLPAYDLPDGFVILSGGRAYTNLNRLVKELTYFGENTLTDTAYPYFMIGRQSVPNQEPTDALYPMSPGDYDVYRVAYAEGKDLYLWVAPDGNRPPLVQNGGAELFSAACIISVPEKTEYDYNVKIGGERDGTLEDALCRVTDENGEPPSRITARILTDSITLTVINDGDRIVEVLFNDGSSFPVEEPTASVTVPLSFLTSVPTTPVYQNDLTVRVEPQQEPIQGD